MKIVTNVSLHANMLAFLLISIISILIYSNTLDGPFIFDDLNDVKNNQHIRLDENYTLKNIYDAAFESPSHARPVANLTFALNYYIDGLNTYGFHWINIFIHVLNGFLVFFLTMLTLQLNGSKNNQTVTLFKSFNDPLFTAALIAALIFVCHPIQTQSVSYIVQRMNSLAALFYFLTLIFYIKGRLSIDSKKRFWLFTGSILCWFMALGSKQTAAILPLTIVIYEWYFFQNFSYDWFKKNSHYFLVLFVLMLIAAIIFLGGQPIDRIMSDYKFREFTMYERLLTESRVIFFYLSLILLPLPSRMNLLHDFSISHSLLDPVTTILSVGAITGLIIFAINYRHKFRILSFCIAWYFINLLIESSVIGLEIIFEHRLYLPLFSFTLLVACFINKYFYKYHLQLKIISIVLILFLSMGSFQRNKVWADDLALWSDVVRKNENSIRGHLNLALEYVQRSRLNEAKQHNLKALKIKPDYMLAHYNLANIYQNTKQYELAVKHYKKAIEINPNNASVRINLGNVMIKQGYTDEAYSELFHALNIDPRNPYAHYNVGNVYIIKNNFEKACKHYQKAISLDKDFNQAIRNHSLYCKN